MAESILIEAKVNQQNKPVVTLFSSLQSLDYSGDYVTGNSGLRYPGPQDDITVSGSNGYHEDAILVFDIDATLNSLTLGDGSNTIGVIEINDGITVIVDTLDAIDPNTGNPNKISFVNAQNSSNPGRLYYNVLLGDSYNKTSTSPVYPITALPVEFISFTATKQSNEMAMLNFATAWEINNAGFEVERSTNGISWNNIGFVAGNGNATEINNYAFSTSLANISAPVVYYRLKQVDFNGQFEYSATRTMRLSATAAAATSVYPNPATSRISVNLDGVAAGEMAKITVMDMSGKIIISANQIVEEGNFTMDMNIDNLTKGNYIVNIASPSVNFNTKLVKF
ncbi:MAG: T9SS type A sorting domain-containing protein [Bacteroidia bacterium]